MRSWSLLGMRLSDRTAELPSRKSQFTLNIFEADGIALGKFLSTALDRFCFVRESLLGRRQVPHGPDIPAHGLPHRLRAAEVPPFTDAIECLKLRL